MVFRTQGLNAGLQVGPFLDWKGLANAIGEL